MLERRLPLLTVLSIFAACATPGSGAPDPSGSEPADAPAAPPQAAAPAAVPRERFTVDATKPLPPGLDETALDPTADPCTDFYQYACGGWMAKTEIPGDKPLYSRGFVTIADRNEQYLKAILEEAAKNALPKGAPFAKQLGDYYATCTDEAKLEKSLPEVKKLVASVTAIKSPTDLARSLALLHQSGFSALFGVYAMQDLKDASQVIAGLDQGGLGLPDRDYYVEEDAKKKEIRADYVAYVAQMFELYGARPEEAKQTADRVMALETRLAKVSQTKVERRDPTKLYNRIERAGLLRDAPELPWEIYLRTLGAKDVQAINVNSVPYFKELSAIAKDTAPEILKDYLTWVVIRSAVPALPKKFQDRAFAFTAKNFSGATEDRPRWKKCVAYTDLDLGEALGREFARRYFPEESKARTSKMIEALQGSIAQNLRQLAWMDEPTRAAALTKLERMVGNNKIGYPGKWRDYAKLKTTRTSFLANSLAANRFEFARQLNKIGKPVDRTEWLMSPPTVNAYYDPQKNEIVFPAGILQPPFFNAEATDAVNFGSMGMVVGHEITHGFDDEGRQFDVDGNLKDWWSEKVGKDFVQRAQCVKAQFADYVAVDDIKVKGDLTLGENIADLGGLKLSFAAMRAWVEKQSPPAAGDYRYDAAQQFFLGFAQSWCTKVRPEMARMRAAVDPHSPPFLRVNGPIANLEAFRQAFRCAPNDKMVRAGPAQCTVW